MNPLLWLLGGGIGLGLLASSGPPRRAPSASPPPLAPPSSGKAPIVFDKASIDQAIAVAMAHEKNPANLQAFAGGLLVYGWTSQGSAMLARAAELQAQIVSHAAAAHHVTSKPAHSSTSPPPPTTVHRSYTKAELQSLIAQTQHDLTGGGGFGAATGAQKTELQGRLAHYQALLAALDHHAAATSPHGASKGHP